MKIIGIIVMAFGLVDLVGSYMEFDLWGGFIGVQLPDVIWSYSAYIEIAIGYMLFSMGSKDADEAIE